MIRLLKRVAIGVTALALIGALAAYQLVRSSLPPVSGDLSVSLLSAEVTIERDAAGVPTITASDRSDLAFGTGFVHGQDRFFQMDLTRRRAAGELAEIIGAVAVPLDRRLRLHRFRARASAVIETMTDAERALLDAYVAGVNAGLASLSAKPFEYYLLQSDPVPWRPEDTLLVVYSMYIELNDERAARDVQRGFAHDVLPPDVFEWMYPTGTEWDAPIVGSATSPAELPGPHSLDLRATNAVFDDSDNGHVADDEGRLLGSNNWAVSGALTETGRALVANDMHLGITTPNVFYRARLVQRDAEARDVSGVTLPGAPVVVAGSNGHIAWGFTNSYGDWTDAVVLQPGVSPDTYRTPAGDLEFDAFDEQIAVKGGASESLSVRETIWGPVLDDVEFPDGEVAVSWIAHHSVGVNITQLELETARSVDAAVAIANRTGIPPQNFVVGDAAGSIAWTIAGRIPRRGAADPLLPADWSDGGGWQGWLAPAEYPRIVNPPSGRIWTANTRVVEGDALAVIGDGGYDLGARGGQIRDGLSARTEFSPHDMLAIQLDDRALFLSRWRTLLLELLDAEATAGHPGRAEYRRLVENWVPRATADSVGYRLVRAFRSDVRSRAFQMLMSPVRARFGPDIPLRVSNQFEGPLWQLVTLRPEHLLSADFDSWRDFLLRSVDENLSYYEQHYGGALADRTWGERNTAAIQHPLSRAVPLLSGWLDMPAEPLDGDGNMPRVQGPSFGASERFAVSPGDEQNGYLHMPAGQSGHPLSDHYRTGHSDWVEGRPSGFLPGETVDRLVLRPGV